MPASDKPEYSLLHQGRAAASGSISLKRPDPDNIKPHSVQLAGTYALASLRNNALDKTDMRIILQTLLRQPDRCRIGIQTDEFSGMRS